jgi:hypothetical protein
MVNKPDFLSNPAIISDFEIPGEVDLDSSANDYVAAHRGSKNS